MAIAWHKNVIDFDVKLFFSVFVALSNLCLLQHFNKFILNQEFQYNICEPLTIGIKYSGKPQDPSTDFITLFPFVPCVSVT
jgi:hypothetical protein